MSIPSNPLSAWLVQIAPGSTTPHYNRQPSEKHNSTCVPKYRTKIQKNTGQLVSRDEAYFMNGGFKKQTTVARVLVWKSGMVTLRFLQYSGIAIPRVSTTVLSCSWDTRAFMLSGHKGRRPLLRTESRDARDHSKGSFQPRENSHGLHASKLSYRVRLDPRNIREDGMLG